MLSTSHVSCITILCHVSPGKAKICKAAWNSYSEATEALVNIKDVEHDVTKAELHIFESYIKLMYDRTSECTDLDLARIHLFTKKNVANATSSSNAFVQHLKRAFHQAVHCSSQCPIGQIKHDLSLCGWRKI
jgi:hypothetical protein